MISKFSHCDTRASKFARCRELVQQSLAPELGHYTNPTVRPSESTIDSCTHRDGLLRCVVTDYRDVGLWAGIPRLQKICNLCWSRMIGNERHSVFESPALQDLRDKRHHLFEGTQADAVISCMWQDDITCMVRLIDECLQVLFTSE